MAAKGKGKNSGKRPDKPMVMRIIVLALAGIMFFGSVLSVFVFR